MILIKLGICTAFRGTTKHRVCLAMLTWSHFQPCLIQEHGRRCPKVVCTQLFSVAWQAIGENIGMFRCCLAHEHEPWGRDERTSGLGAAMFCFTCWSQAFGISECICLIQRHVAVSGEIRPCVWRVLETPQRWMQPGSLRTVWTPSAACNTTTAVLALR